MRLVLASGGLLAVLGIGFGATQALALAQANPASVFCEQRGGSVDIHRAPSGAEQGICVLRDGTRIDEWAYFRNNHRTTAH